MKMPAGSGAGLMNDRFSADDLPRKRGLGPPRSPWPIELAHIRPFRIGDVEVRPPSREVVRGEECELLEPLVMQVLVALASAKGDTLSRDDLIAACWGGRAVSDDAVNRVVSRLRALGRTFGSFEIETITKVGYRLVERTAHLNGSAMGISRRHVVVAGGATVGLGLLGLAALRPTGRADISPHAHLLIQKGLEALQINDSLETQDPGDTLQAIALLNEATLAAPNSATAWGGLAMAYAVRKRTTDLSERQGLDLRSRGAAKRALELDPVEMRALGALRLLDPVYRNWKSAERADREALRKNPTVPILLFIMSDLLGSVGRWKEAAQFSTRLDRRKFLIPGADRKLLMDLWASGDLQRADNQLNLAVRQWPQHPQVWRTRLTYLMYSGRANEALAIIRDSKDRPLELKPEYFEAIRTTAEALAGQRPTSDAISHILNYLDTNRSAVLQVAQACVALGDQRTALALFDGYYFAEGAYSRFAPEGGDQDRLTNALFQPVMRGIWGDVGFSRLTERIGLEEYWRQTNTTPDFRRPA